MNDWRDEAACLGVDPDLFFPQQGGSSREAKAVCNACPSRFPCLQENLHEKFGVFGGKTEQERRKMRRALKTMQVRAA